MKTLSRKAMSSARFSTVALLVICALPSTATTTYSYVLSETVPCHTGCLGNLVVTGVIHVDKLGTLSESNFVTWALAIDLGLTIDLQGQPTISLTGSNSTFEMRGSPDITATASQLTVMAFGGEDRILFWNDEGQYSFAGNPTGHSVWYGNDVDAYGVKLVEFPATLILSAFEHPGPHPAPVPEPATGVLMLLSTVLIFPALKRIRH